MLHLIERLLPAALHRLALKIAFRMRHYWRLWRKAPITGCNVVVTDLAGDILLLRHSYGPAVWGLPGGGVKRGEDPEAAAGRELAEELALTGGVLERLGEMHTEISGSPCVVYLFALVTDRHPVPDEREVIEARFFPEQSLPERISEATSGQLALWRERKTSPEC